MDGDLPIMEKNEEFVRRTLFDNNVKEIRLKTWEKNLPCQKLAEKLGFEKVDVIKGDHKDSFTGEISDCFLYSLTNSFI